MKKTNGFLLAVGFLEIACAFAYAFVAVMFFVVGIFAKAFESLSEEGGSSDSTILFVALGIFVLGILISIVLAVIFFANCRKTHEQLVKRRALMITSIVFAFVFGVIICGTLALCGYMKKDAPEPSTPPASVNE